MSKEESGADDIVENLATDAIKITTEKGEPTKSDTKNKTKDVTIKLTSTSPSISKDITKCLEKKMPSK